MRTHNFNYGSDPTTFVTNHNANFREFPSQGQEKAGTSEDIRKTHFIMGKQSGPMMTAHQIDYPAKKAEHDPNRNFKDIARGFQATSFKLGDDGMAKESSSHIHFQHYPHDTEQLNQEKKNQLRATHFELGTHPFVGASTTHTAHNQKKSDVSIQS